MARSASKESLGADGTRFGDEQAGADVELARPARPREGSLIDGKYRLERLLGEGGMGTVWRAHHLQLDLPVAIKLLRAGPDNATLSERLKLEARASARLVHPAIVRVFDVDTSEHGEPFIVMELLSGENLAEMLERGRLSGVSAVQLLLPIAEALALAHAKGIVHRDLKPPNVFLAQDGERMQPKLLDFGIAKLTTPLAASLTDTGVSVGSPDYMSPEQARGMRDVDDRADIWSFSVVLYEAVTGATPFEGDNYNALMRAIVEDEPAPLPIDENLDQGLAELILWGLAKERSERAGSIQELGRELARWLIDRGVTEDVCGAPLGPKWITRVAQKSVPVIQLDAPEPVRPATFARGGTLVSARQTKTPLREPGEVSQASEVPGSRRPPAWLLAAVLLTIGGGIVWAFAGKPAFEGRAVSGPAVGSAHAAVPGTRSAEPAVEPNPVPIGVASAPAQPPETASAKSAPVSAIHSAPAGAPQPKPRDAKPAAESAKPPSAAKPGRDVHDETRELLQAY